MAPPKRWTPNDPITAEQLNQAVFESVISRREVVLGNGLSLVNESLGNQTANMRRQMTKLVVATTDFLVSATTTDLNTGVLDDVPSGLVKEVRLNRKTGTHAEDNLSGDFRAWDPVSGLSAAFCALHSASDNAEVATKSACDVFYVIYNEDSKRWEVLTTGASQNLRHAIVCDCVGDGWYVMEFADCLPSAPPDCDPLCASTSASASNDDYSCSSSASNSGDPCSLCNLSGFECECGGPATFDADRDAGHGNGTFVYAYDKRTVPLKIGGAATIAWLGDLCDTPCGSASASASASASDSNVSSNLLYTVLNGDYELVTIPHEVWECCPIEGIKKVACYTFIVEGVMCIGPTDPCDSASASASV